MKRIKYIICKNYYFHLWLVAFPRFEVSSLAGSAKVTNIINYLYTVFSNLKIKRKHDFFYR